MTEIQLIYYWTRAHLTALQQRQRERGGDPERATES
jgi:hypothetical protein